MSEFLHEPPAIAPTDAWEARELGERLRKAQSKLKGVTRKGIDAMIFMSQGFTCKEIGEMYGTSANSVSAWVSKARKALKLDAEFMQAVSEQPYEAVY